MIRDVTGDSEKFTYLSSECASCLFFREYEHIDIKEYLQIINYSIIKYLISRDFLVIMISLYFPLLVILSDKLNGILYYMTIYWW